MSCCTNLKISIVALRNEKGSYNRNALEVAQS